MLGVNPISRSFGFDRGTPIDRYYIEIFLHKHSSLIYGVTLEIEENLYSKKFGNNINKHEILSFSKDQKNATIIGDLSIPEKLPKDVTNCFICTQTLNFIYDFKKAIVGIYNLLKPEGIALVTVAGICQISRYDADRWGDFWRFNPQGIEKAFKEVFGEQNITMEVYGNSYSATMFLNGFAAEECNKKKLDYLDKDYPITITIIAKK